MLPAWIRGIIHVCEMMMPPLPLPLVHDSTLGAASGLLDSRVCVLWNVMSRFVRVRLEDLNDRR